ncbi:MAG: FecR family protein [Bacteroidales bacterium]
MKIEEVNIDLVVKFLTGEATAEEKQQLFSWANENYENKKLYVQLKDIWEATHALTDKRFGNDKAWETIRQRIEIQISTKKKEERLRILQSIIRVAAIVVITFGITWLGFRVNKNNQHLVSKNEIIVPLGSKTQMLLPDGSRVWVNSGSSLSYTSDFNDTSRIVRLTGEAYFEVVKNPDKPFVVKTGSLDIKAYGTVFNVKSYPEDNYIEALLVKGEVTVFGEKDNKVLAKLVPNQKTIYFKENAHVAFEKKVEKVEKTPEQEKILTINPKVQMVLVETRVENFTAWKDQNLVFNSETFDEIVVKLERWYGVNIEVMDESIKSERFTGKFIHNEPLVQVLEAIKLTTRIKYTIKLNDVYITSDKK